MKKYCRLCKKVTRHYHKGCAPCCLARIKRKTLSDADLRPVYSLDTFTIALHRCHVARRADVVVSSSVRFDMYTRFKAGEREGILGEVARLLGEIEECTV